MDRYIGELLVSMLPINPKVYDDGRTKQAFKDQADVNKILKKAQRTGTLSHLQRFEGQYGDFSNFDFMEAQQQLAKANSIFEQLPSELRREFNNTPQEFFAFATNPENAGKLSKLLPELAEPGDFNPEKRMTADRVAAINATIEGGEGHGEPPDAPGPPPADET